jgi:hypothetical protein
MGSKWKHTWEIGDAPPGAGNAGRVGRDERRRGFRGAGGGGRGNGYPRAVDVVHIELSGLPPKRPAEAVGNGAGL